MIFMSKKKKSPFVVQPIWVNAAQARVIMDGLYSSFDDIYTEDEKIVVSKLIDTCADIVREFEEDE